MARGWPHQRYLPKADPLNARIDRLMRMMVPLVRQFIDDVIDLPAQERARRIARVANALTATQ